MGKTNTAPGNCTLVRGSEEKEGTLPSSPQHFSSFIMGGMEKEKTYCKGTFSSICAAVNLF